MLVLSRQQGESLILMAGRETITVTVVGIRGNKVRIGVQADDSVSVIREEIADRIGVRDPLEDEE